MAKIFAIPFKWIKLKKIETYGDDTTHSYTVWYLIGICFEMF